MQIENGFAAVNGASLYYETCGAGQNVVVCLHGFALDCRVWDAQLEPLAGAGFRVVRYDLRGYGRSSLPDGAPEAGAPEAGAYDHAADLAALLDHLDVTAAALLGLSMGGAAAIDFALDFPARARALALAGTTLNGFRYSMQQRDLDGPIWAAGRSQGVEAARRMWLAHPLFQPALRSPQAAHFRALVEAYSGWHWAHKDPWIRRPVQAAARLGELRLPVLALTGEHDLPDFQRIAATLRDNIPGARWAVIPGAGHMANLEAAGKFNNLLVEFLRQAPDDPASPVNQEATT